MGYGINQGLKYSSHVVLRTVYSALVLKRCNLHIFHNKPAGFYYLFVQWPAKITRI